MVQNLSPLPPEKISDDYSSFKKENSPSIKNVEELVSSRVKNSLEEEDPFEVAEKNIEDLSQKKDFPKKQDFEFSTFKSPLFSKKIRKGAQYGGLEKTTPKDRIIGGVLGAGVGTGAMFGILHVLANARYWAWVPDIIAGPLTTASGALSPFAPLLFIGGATLGLIWGAKKLWKLWRQ